MVSGPLAGLRIIEFAAIGPVPFCGMLLSDMGADVIRIDRPGDGRPGNKADILGRGRRSIGLNLKEAEDARLAKELIAKADGLIEGFRPGVMERLGLGPEKMLALNPALVYGRMTGWGQTGPLKDAAGHDLNYIALTGALHAMGRAGEPPNPPLNLVGDYGGGALYLAMGLLAALLHVKTGGKGQVIDVAMTDGTASLTTMFHSMRAMGMWRGAREANLLDGGAHFYDCYTCKDGKWISVGAIEPQFYSLLLEKTGLADEPDFKAQMDASKWPALKTRLKTLFATRTRDEWCDIMEGTDICFAPVLSFDEAPLHPHNKARETFVEFEGIVQPAPAPRFSETPAQVQGRPAGRNEHRDEILTDWGIETE